MQVSTYWPSPVRSRWSSAWSTATVDWKPLPWSHWPNRYHCGAAPPAGLRARLPVGGGVAVDGVGLDGLHRLVVEAHGAGDAPAAVGVDDVGGLEQAGQHGAALLAEQVQGDAALAPLAAEPDVVEPE